MLRLVEGGDGGDVVAAGAGEFFLGDQIFEDTTDGLGAAFAGDLGGFCRGVEGGAERGELRGERLGAGVKLDDLAANSVAGLFEFEFAPQKPEQKNSGISSEEIRRPEPGPAGRVGGRGRECP